MKVVLLAIVIGTLSGCACAPKPLTPELRQLMFDDVIHALPRR